MRKTITIVSNTIATLALTALAARYIVSFWALSLLNSLQTHAALAVAVLMGLTLILRRNRPSTLLLVAALGLAGHSVLMKREFAIRPSAAEIAAGPAFRLLSFNMLFTNLGAASDVADMLVASKADVAVVLEGAPLFFQLPRLAAAFPYRIGCGEKTPTCDLILFSRHPLETIDIANLTELRQDRVLAATVRLSGRPVRVVAAHLSKPYFDEYARIELTQLKTWIGDDPGPLVLAGDFNSGTIAPAMQQMLRRLSLRTVPSEPATWPVGLAATGLGIAIDHIYSRPPLVPLSVERLPEPYGSNHYGLFATFALRDR